MLHAIGDPFLNKGTGSGFTDRHSSILWVWNQNNSQDNYLLDILDSYLLRILRFHTRTLIWNLRTSEILPRLVSFWKSQLSYIMTSNLVTWLIIQFCKPSLIISLRQMQLSLPVSMPERRANRQNKEVNR